MQKKQFTIWEDATCVSMNALHSQKNELCQQDYAIWKTALKKNVAMILTYIFVRGKFFPPAYTTF